MGLFKNPADERKILEILKTYIEEWGAANVRVMVPAHWRQFGMLRVGSVPVLFGPTQSIIVIAGTRQSHVSCEVVLC